MKTKNVIFALILTMIVSDRLLQMGRVIRS